MKTIKKIDINKKLVYFTDGSTKYIDNYILELEDKLLQIEDIVNGYIPNTNKLCEAMDKINEVLYI